MFSFQPIKRIFRDFDLQNQFEKDGYVIVNFYTDDKLNEVIKLYDEMHTSVQSGFFPSSYAEDKAYRSKIDAELKSIGLQKLDEIFIDYQIMNGCFIVKQPNSDSYLHVHQDMTLVDESLFAGINVWTTTTDLTPDNGVLYLLPGSHRFFPTYRGHTLPGFYDPIQEEIKDYMLPIYLKAGQAIIFDQSIVHFSPPNNSDKIRIATNVFIAHKEAKFRICYHDKNDEKYRGKVELFEQESSFMTDYEQFGKNIYNRPSQGKSLGLFEYNFPVLTIEELENKFGKKKLRTSTPTKIIITSSSNQNVKRKLWEVYTAKNIFLELRNRIKK